MSRAACRDTRASAIRHAAAAAPRAMPPPYAADVAAMMRARCYGFRHDDGRPRAILFARFHDIRAVELTTSTR